MIIIKQDNLTIIRDKNDVFFLYNLSEKALKNFYRQLKKRQRKTVQPTVV